MTKKNSQSFYKVITLVPPSILAPQYNVKVNSNYKTYLRLASQKSCINFDFL